MDLFSELSKQTTKLLNNFSQTMDEISSLATGTTSDLSNILLLKGNLENCKTKLGKLYKSIGAEVVNGNEDISALVNEAKELKEKVEKIEQQIEKLKLEVQLKKEDLKQVVTSSVKTDLTSTKDVLTKDINNATENIQKEIDDLEATINKKVDNILKDDNTEVISNISDTTESQN